MRSCFLTRLCSLEKPVANATGFFMELRWMTRVVDFYRGGSNIDISGKYGKYIDKIAYVCYNEGSLSFGCVFSKQDDP